MNEDMNSYYNTVLNNLTEAAKTNRFASKEEFNKYLEGIKKNGMPESMLSEEKKKELLSLYDEYHKVEEAGLDMQNYTGSSLNDNTYIINTKEDTILKTNVAQGEIPDEFKKVQTELTAKSQDDLVNANQVYQDMKNNRKEEVTLIPLVEMIERDDVSEELLGKIKFFVKNKNINPFQYKISPETGMFYNTEIDEILEVRKNSSTGLYEIVKGSQVVYRESAPESKSSVTVEEQEEYTFDQDDEIRIVGKEDQKVRRRRLPNIPKDITDQAAFAKGSILIVVSIFTSLFLSMFIVLLK